MRSLFIAGSDPPPLLKAVDQPLNPGALPILLAREAAWPPAAAPLLEPLLALILALGDHARNPSFSQRPAALWVSVPFVEQQPLVPLAGPAPPPSPIRGPARHADPVEHRRQLGAVVALALAQHHGQRSSFSFARQVDLGRQAAAAASECLASNRLRSPLFPACRRLAGWRRAPAACWCARTVVESTAA